MKKMIDVRKAWAIVARFDWGEAIVGQYWFVGTRPFPCTGYTVAVFRTRAEARRARQERGIGDSRITQVVVTVAELG